jgi:predicted deacylase
VCALGLLLATGSVRADKAGTDAELTLPPAPTSAPAEAVPAPPPEATAPEATAPEATDPKPIELDPTARTEPALEPSPAPDAPGTAPESESMGDSPPSPEAASGSEQPEPGTDAEIAGEQEAAETDESTEPPWGPFRILGTEIQPGEKARLSLATSESFAGSRITVPVTVLHGPEPGSVICITGGIHGDELNGVEIARSILASNEPSTLRGTLIGIPIVNLHGFRRSSRYLPDRRDLNRYFPGHPRGSSASRIASAVFGGVIRQCDALVDLHSGSFHRANIPQVRANLNDPATLDLALAFGPEIAVHSGGQPGTLRRAANDIGIPSITYEGGEPMRFQRREIDRGVTGVQRLLEHVGMTPVIDPLHGPTEVFWSAAWIRVDEGGILRSMVRLGQRVEPGQLLGAVTDPLTDERTEVHAPFGGRLIGMALDQVVIPGFAAFHIAWEGRTPSDDELVELDTPPVETVGPDPEATERPE